MTIVVAAFGEPWSTWARERAIPSAQQFGVPVVVATGATVAEARNNGLSEVDTEFVVHLDADDELTPSYLDAMAEGTADVRVPAVEYVQPDGQISPATLWDTRCRWQREGGAHQCECMVGGSWVPIGAMVRTELLRRIGGWHEHPVYEDFCVWLRCHVAGALFEAMPKAVYRAHVNPSGGRNRSLLRHERALVHHQIAQECGVETPDYILDILRRTGQLR